jgi:hypothetical protein
MYTDVHLAGVEARLLVEVTVGHAFAGFDVFLQLRGHSLADVRVLVGHIGQFFGGYA